MVAYRERYDDDLNCQSAHLIEGLGSSYPSPPLMEAFLEAWTGEMAERQLQLAPSQRYSQLPIG